MFGVGAPTLGAQAPQVDWLIVGEAPGENEDLQGEPFVGQSGQLLDNMLKAVGLSRQAQGEGGVYIANAIKCRPPGNHNPTPQELATCAPYLARQVALVQPQIILLMGRFAVQSVLQTTEPIGKLRGRVHEVAGVPVIVKPATATAWLTQRMVRDVVEAGILPPGALSVVCGSSAGLLDALEPFDVLSFTGSAETAAVIRSHPAVVQRSVRVNIEADSLNSALLLPGIGTVDHLDRKSVV